MIIAKNEQMKKVLGLGYPSAPIYTVEEFGDRQVEIMQKQAKVTHYDIVTANLRFLFQGKGCMGSSAANSRSISGNDRTGRRDSKAKRSTNG